MIVKGTRQLGSFKRGINLYIPRKTTPSGGDGLLLSLDANNNTSYDGSGSTWYDLASPSNDITLVGDPVFNTDGPEYFRFDGSSQYGTSTGETVPSTAYTKCVWFRLNSYAINNLVSSDVGGHFMYFNGTNTLYCGHSDWNDYQAYPSTATFNLNTWYFAVLTFNTTDGMKLYINGQLDSSYTANKNPHLGNGSTNIATYDGGNLLDGGISMVMTYNRALTETEVLNKYNETKNIFSIWKVAIFGAGTASSNGEYVWDGTTFFNDKPQYNFFSSHIRWNGSEWVIYDSLMDEGTYASNNLSEGWSPIFSGDPQVPSSALSYAQDSFIFEITISNASPSIVNGNYARGSGGDTAFAGQGGNVDCSIYFTDTINNPNWNAVIYDGSDGIDRFKTDDAASLAQVSLFHWNIIDGFVPAETTNIIYSA